MLALNPGYRIYLVDVFTHEPYSGNPLAVVAGSEPLADATMQRIAAEINFSETTFLGAAMDADGGYPLRVFTPVREIAFAGHPLLGSAWVLRRFLLQQALQRVQLNLATGPVAVSFEVDADGSELCWFTAPPITPGARIEAQAIAAALGLSAADIDTRTPVQVLSAGTAAVIVPLRNRDALRRARLDLAAFAPLASAGHPPLTYLYCRQTASADTDIAARFFFEAGEVREDPATGNGAAFLGAYMLQHENPGAGGIRLRIEQGHELGRPALVHLHASGREVRVGGGVVATVAGEMLAADRGLA